MATTEEVKTVVETVNEAIESATKALELYDKVVDHVIPWQTFDETVANLTKFQKDYSSKAGELVGNVKTLLLSSKDEYVKSVQSVFEWSSLSSTLLKTYLKLFENYSAAVAESQKKLVIKVLEEGIKKMAAAQEQLQASSRSFNNASGQLEKLQIQLSNDFSAESSYYQTRVDQIRKEAYAGAAAGAVGGPFGLIISYSIAAGVVEGTMIPALNAKLKETKEFVDSVLAAATKASNDIDNAKRTLQEETKVIGEMKTKTEETAIFVEDVNLREVMKVAATELIASCDAYMKRHR